MEIGFSQPIELPWLEHTAFLTASGRNPDQIRVSLDELLSGKIAANSQSKRSSRSKRITILMRIWLGHASPHEGFRQDGLALIQKIPANLHLPLHYGMTLVAFPFFTAVAENIGRLLTIQDAFTIEQLQRRMRETLGQRDTVKFATTRVVRSLVDWRCLDQTKRSSYQGIKPHTVDHPEICLWLYEAVLLGKGQTTMSADSLTGNKALFPFKLLPLKHLTSGDSRLTVARHGMDGEIVERRPHLP